MQQHWLRSWQMVSLCDGMAPFMHAARIAYALEEVMADATQHPGDRVEVLASLSNLRITGVDAKDELRSHSALGETPYDRELRHSWASGCRRSGRVNTIRLRDVAGFGRDFESPIIFTWVELVAMAKARLCELA